MWVEHATHGSFLLAVVVAVSLAVVKSLLRPKRMLLADDFGWQVHVPLVHHNVWVGLAMMVSAVTVLIVRVVILH
jgi:hypothetical protein